MSRSNELNLADVERRALGRARPRMTFGEYVAAERPGRAPAAFARPRGLLEKCGAEASSEAR